MSCRKLPNYPDFLEREKIREILIKMEPKIVESGHLNKDEGIIERIKIDKLILDKYGLIKMDIYNNHYNMANTFRYLGTNRTKTELHQPKFNNLLPEKFGDHWSMWVYGTYDIELNGGKYRVSMMTWGGAEQCPIEKLFTDEYKGYERGDRDWFIENLETKELLWVPDLLPYQVGMWGFFQSPSSPYRLDPKKYIKFFNLDKMKGKVKMIDIDKDAKMVELGDKRVERITSLFGANEIEDQKSDNIMKCLLQ